MTPNVEPLRPSKPDGSTRVFCATCGHSEFVHEGNRGCRYSVCDCNRFVVGAEAELPEGFRIHDLRHTCVALLIAQGAHAKEIAERLGHSSPVVTMTVYAHVLPSLDERLTEGLEEAFRSADRSTSATIRAELPSRGLSSKPPWAS